MALKLTQSEFEVLRDNDKCISCQVCVRQCANDVHSYDKEEDMVYSEDSNCVGCHRCESLCPTGAVKIKRKDPEFRENFNWTQGHLRNIYKQAESGGVILTGMGCDRPYRIYWDHILFNAAQVTNPSIDPLREPMEIKTFIGRKPDKLEMESLADRNRITNKASYAENNAEIKAGEIDNKIYDNLTHGLDTKTNIPPQLELSTPIMFSAMSYGSISFNACKSLAAAASQFGTFYNTGEGGLHKNLYRYAKNTIVQVASGRFGVDKDYLSNAAAIEIKIGQGAKPGIGGHLPGEKVSQDISSTRMIPVGTDALSPAPHHDIYSIEDLAQLIYALKEATEWEKPVGVKISAVHNVAPIASGIVRAGADFMTCHLCQKCYTGKCNWGIATQDPYLTKRLNPEIGTRRLLNLLRAWSLEIKEMLGGAGINAIESFRGNREHLRGVSLTERISTNLLVIAIGVIPNIDFLDGSRIEVGRGIIVDEHMRTSREDIYAAGDVVDSIDLILQKRRNIAIWPLAVKQGAVAGANMAGGEEKYEGGFFMNSVEILGIPSISMGMSTVKTLDDIFKMPGMSGTRPLEEAHNRATRTFGISEEREISLGIEVLGELRPEKNLYKKIVVSKNRIIGVIMVGNIERAGIYAGLIKNRIDISSIKESLLREDFGIIQLPSEYRKHLVVGEGDLYKRAKETVEDYRLGREAIKVDLDEEDRKVLSLYIRNFCKHFGMAEKDVITSDYKFVKLVPSTHRPYGKLYAY